MKLFGIALRRPGAHETSAATIMAVGLWVAAVGAIRASGMTPFDAADAGALLLVVVSACIGARCGIRVEKGGRHLAANLMVTGALLCVYNAALAVAA